MKRQNSRLFLLGILLLGWAVFLWGIQRDLPYEPFIDEPIFVERAIHMAATGDPNPHWFGNPGSTTIYPLAGFYHLWFAATQDGSLFRADPRLAEHFAAQITPYYITGRLLTIAYGLLTIALTFALGRRMWGERIGLLAALFLIFYPSLAWYTTVVRTDTSAMFFVALSLWYGLLAADEPRPRHFALAGVSIGLALSSRYLMLPIYAVYLALFAIQIPVWRKQGQFPGALRGFLLGGLLSVLVFALSSPFFFLDFATAWQNLLIEARSVHIGADGKSYLERAYWYLTKAIPQSIYGVQMAALLLAIGWAFWRRQWRVVVLAGFLLVYVALISVPALHWKRWTIQISPVLALLAAYGVDEAAGLLAGRFAPGRYMAFALLLGVAALAQPAFLTGKTVIKLGSTSTRIEARHWIEENLPAHSRVIGELYTAPLQNTSFVVVSQPFLPERPFDFYLSGEFDFVMTSSEISNRFVADPARYAPQLEFYNQLARLPLVAEFAPTAWQGGSTIRIFALEHIP
ncbi:MAG: glycosyltransferase family 39 protein [Caldilineaceae bacterium]|nr:glycosyltransferase family 39 protein [Caldilineaceae bacterium]